MHSFSVNFLIWEMTINWLQVKMLYLPKSNRNDAVMVVYLFFITNFNYSLNYTILKLFQFENE